MTKENFSVVFSLNTKLCFKILLVGDSNTGKSSLAIRFVKEIFQENYRVTAGVEYYSKILKINEKQFALQIWDTAGTVNYKSLVRSLYNFTHCIVLIYDSLKNFDEGIEKWMNEIKEKAQDITRIVLVRTKTDEIAIDEQQQQKIDNFVQSNLIDFFMPVSSKINENVSELFTKIGELLLNKYQTNESFRNIGKKNNCSIILDNQTNSTVKTKKQSICCKNNN